MATAIWRPGRRLFSVAAVLMILTAVVHTAGSLAPPSQGPAEQKLFEAMRSYRIPLGLGMNPSMQDIFRDITFTMSITFVALGLNNLLLAASPDTSDRLLRHVTWLNALWVGAFLILCWACQVPPGLISAVIIEAAVLAALFFGRASIRPAEGRGAGRSG